MMNENKKKKRNVDDDDNGDKDVDEENDGNVVRSRIVTVRSSTHHHNCQRKSFHFRGEGQVLCACSYDQDYIIESTATIFLRFFVLLLTSYNTIKKIV